VAWSPNSKVFGNATTPFTFTDSSTGTNINAYFWDFNDGNTSTLQSPSNKKFPTPATEVYQYSINHSATDSFGTGWAVTSWLNRSSWVTVYKNLTPTISFTQDITSGAIPLTVAFTATPAGAIKIDSWLWNFGDPPTSTSQNPSHTYNSLGVYTVSLTATNYTLGQTMVTKTNLIVASNPPPSMAWSNSPPVFGNATTSFQFTDSSTGTNINAWFWNFNDANTSTTKSPAKIFPGTLAESVLYTINHSATDSFGTGWAVTSWLNRSNWVTVYKNLTPTISFTQDKIMGIIPFTVTFTATPAGAIKVDSWSWNFGDSGTSTSQSPPHAYTTAGTRTVSLTATNYTLGQTTVTKTNLIKACADKSPSWYDSGWLYRKKITLSKATGSTQSNFPVLIGYTDTDLRDRALDNGYDIFFTDANGVKLSHERESFDGNTGALLAWVKIPSLSKPQFTDIYMYYGNPSAADQENKNNVWSNGFKAVWHLKETPGGSGTIKDSTSNTNHGTDLNGPVSAAGKIGNAIYFDGINDVIRIDNSNGNGHSLDFLTGQAFTISTWVTFPNAQNTHIFGKRDDSMDQYQLGIGSLPDVFFRAGGEAGYGSTLSSSTWYYYAVVVNSNTPNLFKNGVQETWHDDTGSRPYTFSHAACDASIGARWTTEPTTTVNFKGTIDELRVSNVVRSADWLSTEYNNQNNPGVGGFINTLGSQETWTC
jgi:PKD repeat protein